MVRLSDFDSLALLCHRMTGYHTKPNFHISITPLLLVLLQKRKMHCYRGEKMLFKALKVFIHENFVTKNPIDKKGLRLPDLKTHS